MDNTVDFAAFQADIYLPDGLEFVDLRSTAEINKNKAPYYFTLSDRTDDHSISSSNPDSSDPQHRLIVAYSGNNNTFYNESDVGTAVLVNFKVKAAANFVGTATIRLEGKIFVTQNEEEYQLESTTTTVTGPEWEEPTGVELTIKSSVKGEVIIFVESGKTQSVKFVPVDGYVIHSVTFNGEDVKESLIDNYYTTPAITEASTINVAFEIATGLLETVGSDRVRVTASNGHIRVVGTIVGETVNVYTSNGVLVNSAISAGDEMEFEAQYGEIYIVKTNNHIVKIMM